MWILESSSELFQGRRMWLKPGKSYLFGRVKKDGVRFAIDNKTVSRKHFIITIDDVNVDDVGNVHSRTRVTIEDQNSKAGTHVNGEHIKNSSRELKNAENYIKPGTLPEDLIIKWHPYVLTFNLLKKEVKSGVLKTKQERVKDLDIRVVSEYIAGQTTHLVVNKRNTPKSLQALIDGKPLVAESYIDSLEYASTPSDLNEEENLSPLEQDFDNAWPDPFDHLPPPGRELTLRPAEAYMPNPNRKDIFENFTFVFLDQTQYDNLLPPITTGHGKALLYKTRVGETTSDELVTFLQNAAGKKGFGDARKNLDKGAVILVRYKGDAGAEEWTNTLINEASLRLDQRAIDQGEFLDAILANDAMLLRQTVPFESNSEAVALPPATAASNFQGQHQPRLVASHTEPTNGIHQNSASQPSRYSQQQKPSQDNGGRPASAPSHQIESETSQSLDNTSQSTIRAARFMIPKKSRVFGFDDDFNPDEVIPYQEDDEESQSQELRPEHPYTPSQADSELSGVKEEPRSSRKRPISPSREASASFDDELNDLFPAAAAMKRRKLAEGPQNGEVSEPAKNSLIPALSKKPKVEKEIDVREIAKAQRKAEEDRLQDDQEDDFRVEPGQPLPVYDVETVLIDLPTRKRASNEVHQAAGDHWDPKWNGRKNFKGFRRAKDNMNGEAGDKHRKRNATKVIVPLVDAKTSTYGMGDQYWDRTQEEKERDRERKRKASQRTTQSQSDQSNVTRQHRSQTVHDIEDEVEGSSEILQTSPEVARLQSEAAEIMDHGIDIEEPRRTRASDTQTTTTTTTPSTRGTKRSANGIGRGGLAKKQKTLPVTVVHGSGSDSDDSDDMKFKFGSRRRGRGKA